jgi:uncharacterized membrane protein
MLPTPLSHERDFMKRDDTMRLLIGIFTIITVLSLSQTFILVFPEFTPGIVIRFSESWGILGAAIVLPFIAIALGVVILLLLIFAYMALWATGEAVHQTVNKIKDML